MSLKVGDRVVSRALSLAWLDVTGAYGGWGGQVAGLRESFALVHWDIYEPGALIGWEFCDLARVIPAGELPAGSCCVRCRQSGQLYGVAAANGSTDAICIRCAVKGDS